jgi:hypothetical protein
MLQLNNKINKNNDYNKYKYIFYIKDYGHFSRALEFKKTILKKTSNDHLLIVLNSTNKKTIDAVSRNFKNIVTFGCNLHKLEYLKMLHCLLTFVFLNKFKCFLQALKIYKKGIYKYFESTVNMHKDNNRKLISFNDQPIEISILDNVLKEQNIVKKSIVYQHGIIALPQFYFPSKSDYFYAYTKDKNVTEYFNVHNKYQSKLYAVGNLKYNKNYQEIIRNNSLITALIILTPSWKFFFNTINKIDKNKQENCKYVLRFHPGMKFSYMAKLLTKFFGYFVDENTEVSFDEFNIVVTEVSTMGFEALSEGKPIAVLIDLNYKIPYYFSSEFLPKIRNINVKELQEAMFLCYKNREEIKNILTKYFG